jgi:hypothetical protein
VNVIGLAISGYQLGMFGGCNRPQEIIETCRLIGMNQALPAFGAPYHVNIHTEKFSCHTLSIDIRDI